MHTFYVILLLILQYLVLVFRWSDITVKLFRLQAERSDRSKERGYQVGNQQRRHTWGRY